MAIFASGVVHEINTPLATVISNLELVSKSIRLRCSMSSGLENSSWLEDEVVTPLEDAREAAQQVRFIVEDLRIFSGSSSADPMSGVDLRASMESALQLSGLWVFPTIKLTKTYGDTPLVVGNETRLRQVFLNLLVNARRALVAGDHNKEIRVTTKTVGQNVLVEVSDNGPGISQEILSRIFDPFFTTQPVGGGTGLGLAISHRLVAEMGGTLTVESEPDNGATFRLTLPMAQSESVSTKVARVPAPRGLLRGRILIIDDDELILRVLKRALGREHEIITAVEGAEALASCKTGPAFDLIFCDLMMPVMSGADFHGELTRISHQEAAKIVFLTGGASTELGRTFLEETCNEFLNKPFEHDTIRDLIQRRLHIARDPRPTEP